MTQKLDPANGFGFLPALNDTNINQRSQLLRCLLLTPVLLFGSYVFPCWLLALLSGLWCFIIGGILCSCLVGYTTAENLCFVNSVDRRHHDHCSGAEEAAVNNSPTQLPRCVDAALCDFVKCAIRCHVQNWYSAVSQDEAFVVSLNENIRRVASVLLPRLRRLDLSKLILEKAVFVAANHVNNFIEVRSQFPFSVVEQQALDNLKKCLHKAVLSRDDEVLYLRSVSQTIVSRTMPDEQIRSSAVTVILQELLTFSVLLPLMDLIADPYIINTLLILLFDPEPVRVYYDVPCERVEVLQSLCASSTFLPDSLLQMKLSDILKDYVLLEKFRAHIVLSDGPAHWIQFLQVSDEILERLRTLARHEDLGSLKGEISYFQFELWKLYSVHFHLSAPEPIDLPPSIAGDLKATVEASKSDLASNLNRMEEALSSTYAFIYTKLQREYMPCFCQSKVYYKHLSGGRDFHSEANNALRLTTQESLFSFTKLKTRLANVFKANIEDGSVPPVSHTDDNVLPQTNGFSRLLRRSSSLSSLETGRDIVFSVDSTATPDEDVVEMWGDCTATAGCSGSVSSAVSVCNNEEAFLLPDFSSPVRNMSTWHVRVPRIEPRRDPSTQRTMYVYIVEVEVDEKLELPQGPSWTVDRRYHEFFALESKLVEFHGRLGSQLPPKKAFVTKSRTLIESWRPHFDEFLQALAAHSDICSSELLYQFLTSDKELTTNFFASMNPLRAIRSVPSKLSRERGQNLSHFLDMFGRSVETFRLPNYSRELSEYANSVTGSTISMARSKSELSVTSVLSDASVASAEFAAQRRLASVDAKLYSSRFGNNFLGTSVVRNSHTKERVKQLSNCVMHSLLAFGTAVSGVYDLLLFLCFKLYRSGSWLRSLLIAVRSLLRSPVDSTIEDYLRQQLNIALDEHRIEALIRMLEQMIFEAPSNPATDAERTLAMVQCCSSIKEFVNSEVPSVALTLLGGVNVEHGHKTIFECVQHPRLNKQLAYVLLDHILEELFPENS